MSKQLATQETPSLWEIDQGLSEALYAAEKAHAAYEETLSGVFDGEQAKAAREACDQADLVLANYVEGALKEVDSVAGVLRYFEAQAEFCKQTKARINERQKRWLARAERLESLCMYIMLKLQKKKFESALNTISRKKNPASVSIDNPADIPRKYVRLTIQVTEDQWDKVSGNAALLSAVVKEREFLVSEIKDALRRKEEVPGASLDDSRERIELD